MTRDAECPDVTRTAPAACQWLPRDKQTQIRLHVSTVHRTFDRGVGDVEWELHNSTNLRLNSVCVCLSTAVCVFMRFLTNGGISYGIYPLI